MGKPVAGEAIVLPPPQTGGAALAAQHLWESVRQQDTAALAELDRRMDEMEAGRNTVPWADATARLDNLNRQGK